MCRGIYCDHPFLQEDASSITFTPSLPFVTSGAKILITTLITRDSVARGVSMGSGRAKILLVEDTEINRVVVRRLARDLNVELEEAENGQAAVDYFQRSNTCDLVLMDKDMPVMNGHEATRWLRSMGVTTPIIALSGDNLPSDRDLFIQAGADDFRSKPLSKVELVELLDKYQLEHYRSR